MAVFQGARLRTTALPAADPVVRPRVAGPATVRTSQRVRPMGRVMAAILVATMLGLVYLTQTLGSNATSSEIRKLEDQRIEFTKDLRRQAIQVELLVDADTVIGNAQKRNLSKLDDLVVLQAP